MNPTPKPLGQLAPESDDERRAAAAIGPADIAELKARTRRLKRSGAVLQDDGTLESTTAKTTRALLLGE